MMLDMKSLPLPVRVAAGLVVTAVEQARNLPRRAVEFPVTAVSQALQASMRVQQTITELAIKGDRVLGSNPVEDKPSWATFDEDEPRSNGTGAGTVTELRPPVLDPEPLTPEPEPVAPLAHSPAAVAAATTKDTEDRTTDTTDPTAAASGPNVLPGYAMLTIPQLRGRLRHLGVEDLRVLLDWEQAHQNRPPFVTMLSNRITTVTEG
jgi:hypothetical protein